MKEFKPKPSPRPEDRLFLRQEFEGVINRVTFATEDGAFKVVSFTTDEGDIFKAAGGLFGAEPGECLRLTGEWKEHPRHGWTFNVTSFIPRLPETEGAIQAYLGSGMIKGVREGTAKKIVDHFGATTLQVLDETPELLFEVPKLTRKTARKIMEEWSSHRAGREAMIFLKGVGLSNALAARLMRHYGEKAVAVLRANPYQAGLDVPRIGFAMADEIAAKMGIARDAPERVQAAFVHLLDRASTEGHTFLPREELVERSTTMLGVSQELVEGNLDAALTHGYIRRVAVGDRAECYFMASLHECESGLAKIAIELLRQAKPLVTKDVDARIADFERRFKFSLAPLQRDAIRSAAAGGLCVITGGPGTGKTTLVRALLHVMKDAQIDFALCSPTGRAAQRLSETTGEEAATIHRLLRWNAQTGRFVHNRENRLPLDLLIVDEASMLDVPLAYSLLSALRDGAAVVFVGDVDQLPSVGPGTFLRDLIRSGRARTTRLDVVFRQAEESLIIRNSHRINQGVGIQSGDPADPKTDFFFIDRDEPEAIREAMLQMATERVPKRLSIDAMEGVQVLTPMRKGALGADELNTLLQGRLNPGGEPIGIGRVRRGDKVIQTVNNYDLDVYNGDVGRIDGIHPETRQVRVVFGKRPVYYPIDNMDELELAYAITIHKSQGSEYPAVVVLMHTSHYIMLKRNLLYTAITRGKRLVVLIGNRRAMFRAISTSSETERMTALEFWLTRPPEKDDLLA